VRFQYVSQATDIHGIDAFGVQPFQQVTAQCFLSVVAAAGSFPVQSPDTLATVSPVFEFRLQPGDFSRRLTESLEQLAAFVQVLLAGRRSTGNEIVRTNIQSGLLCGQWSVPCIVRHSHGLRSSEGAVSLVVPQFQSALILVLGPVRVATDF